MSRSADKRPSVFSADFSLNIPAATTAEVSTTPVAAEAAQPAPVAKVDKGIIKTSTYLPREVHDVLREIAFHERNKVHDLLIEGVEHVLKTRRHASISELTAPRNSKVS